MRIILALALLLQAAGGRQVDITVTDTQGLAIEGLASVGEKQATLRKTAVSTLDGARFENLAAAVHDVRVEANRLRNEDCQEVDLRTQTTASVKVELELVEDHREERVNVVTFETEEVVGEMPASTNVLRAEEIHSRRQLLPTISCARSRRSACSAGPAVLPRIPPRRASRCGVSGPSGVSRTLVLIDNIPFNDPFGGWVYWTRVPLASVERVEMIEGAQLQRLRQLCPGRSHQYRHRASGGTHHQGPHVTGWARPRTRSIFRRQCVGQVLLLLPKRRDSGPTVISLCRNWKEECHSAVRSTPKRRSTIKNVNLKIDSRARPIASAGLTRRVLFEDRINAKDSTTTGIIVPCGIEQYDLEAHQRRRCIRTRDDGDLQVRAWGNFETFHSNNHGLTAGPARDGSRLTLMQRVPTNDTGGMVQWARRSAARTTSRSAPIGAGWTETAWNRR